MKKALNDQLQLELSSSYLYLAMAAHFDDQSLPGFATWMKAQADEERGHGMRIYDYLCDQGARVVLQAIEKPTTKFGTARKIFQTVLSHEQKVTASINKIYELAMKEKDYATQVFLQWFISEQVEEEKTAQEVLDHITALEEQQHPMLIMDKRMGKRGS